MSDILGNGIIRTMAEKQLRKYFKENNVAGILITQDKTSGEFSFTELKENVITLTQTDYNNLLKLASE